jgi:spore maturation protein CgeB
MSLLNIIHVGPADILNTSIQRAQAFVDLGHKVKRVLTRQPNKKEGHLRKLCRYVFYRFGYPKEQCGENSVLINTLREVNSDIIWIEKGLTIWPITLKTIKKLRTHAMLISFSPDDMMNPYNQSHYYIKCIPLYDLHVTTKTYNVSELLNLGAFNVEFMPNGYDPHTHRPMSLSRDDIRMYGADVSFVGTFEEDRAKSMTYLAEHGIRIRIWGDGWQKLKRRHPNLHIEGKAVYGDEYAKVLCATKINLGFLRKVNRDKQTTRSIEIPACGAFMLGERSDEHLELFKEGVEAEFFSDNEELLQKTIYYLKHEEERIRIAGNGRERCINSGYSYQERLAKVLDHCRVMMSVKGSSYG